jgi:hypothetical protein
MAGKVENGIDIGLTIKRWQVLLANISVDGVIE